MTESAVVINKRNTEYTMYVGISSGTIRIKGKVQNTSDFITVTVDGQSFDVQLSCDVVVEGRMITVKSKSLPIGTSLTVDFELLESIQYDLKWGVQSGKWQTIYFGSTFRTILIEGPQDQKDKSSKPGEVKSILIRKDGQTSEPVIVGSSMYANGESVVIIANQPGTDAWLTGKYTLLRPETNLK